ncbi:hypothetical protein AVEN_234407-1 [Araneus ventricosus]|uniref:Uncharacterized protein n=1 Tax=Araneus ventricosus TaxID=182803 RepID=A0A4Y2A8C1_ARAVE|nr:hypothetical protein AVEN_234407-1 [Araneus ventricosus]
MTRMTSALPPPSPNFHAAPRVIGRLATTYDLAYNKPHTRRIFSGIGFRTWNPPAPKAEILPLGHRGLSGQTTRAAAELAPPLQTSALHQREDVCPHTYDLTCNRPNTRRIFSGIGFRTRNLRPQVRDLTTKATAALSGVIGRNYVIGTNCKIPKVR